MSSIAIHLAGAIMMAIIVAIAFRTQKPAELDGEGWRVFRPAWLLHGWILALFGFAALMGYIYLFVGSSRPDAASQMVMLLILATASALGGLYLVWDLYRRTFMWRGDILRVRTWGRGETLYRISEICAVFGRTDDYDYRLIFDDGSVLELQAHMHGVREFMSRLPPEVFVD